MLSRLRNRQRGFTLIELLIVIAIIGIIAALLIPNFLDSLQKARQKRSQGDLRNVGTAWMAWLTDEYQASAAGRRAGETYSLPTGNTSEPTYLQTRYIQKLPEGDGWKNEFNYFRATDIYTQETIMAIRSNGFKGKSETAATISVMGFAPTDYEQDIVWGDGFFIRWPGKNS